ncbi:ribbon-helix-helix protein, CopG family [Neptunomonas sp.]
MYERIRIAAFKEDVSKSEIIRRALHSFLSQHEKEAA